MLSASDSVSSVLYGDACLHLADQHSPARGTHGARTEVFHPDLGGVSASKTVPMGEVLVGVLVGRVGDRSIIMTPNMMIDRPGTRGVFHIDPPTYPVFAEWF